jgi:hypothetical protein
MGPLLKCCWTMASWLVKSPIVVARGMLDEQRGLHLEKAIAIGSALGQFLLRGRKYP